MVDIPPSKLPAAGTLLGAEPVMVSQLSTSVTISAATISALASDNSFNDSGSGFIAAGFAVGNYVHVVGFTGNAANNIYSAKITALTAGKMTIGGTDGDVIVDDAAGETVTITKWVSVRTTTGAFASAGGGALHLYEERPSGSDGGQGIANVWVARLLNTTVLNTITGASRLSSTVTVTIASPGVFTWNSNNLVNGETISFTTTGALPTGLATNTTYYVVSAAANTFSVSATQGGAAINTSGTQSGTHTAHTSGIELAAGTYDISARVPACNAGSNTGYKARLYNKTGAATLLEGTSVWGAANTEMESRVQGRFTLSGTSTIRLEMIATAARASGFGINAGITSVNNHFTDVLIRRVA